MLEIFPASNVSNNSLSDDAADATLQTHMHSNTAVLPDRHISKPDGRSHAQRVQHFIGTAFCD